MSAGKYMSLEEAKNSKELKRFIREHPSKSPKNDFDETEVSEDGLTVL